MSFIKIFYQLNEERENEIKSLEYKSSDFDKVIVLNTCHIISIYYNFLEKELEIEISGNHVFEFAHVPEKIYKVLVGCLEN